MSLQVWLPLNGNLNNYGLSNYTLHTLPSGASWSAGKLGNNLNISNAGTTATINQISGLSTFSISFWYKFATGQTFTTYSDLINISMTSANKGNFRIEVSNNNGTTTNWYGHNLTDGGMGLYTTTPGVWYHDAIVVDGTNLKRYVNGVLVSEKTVNIAYTTSSFKLGDAGMYCQLADVRVYDHALSPKEIKEISKGLVCHYPLDNNGCGQTNLYDFEAIASKWTNEGESSLTTIADSNYGNVLKITSIANQRIYRSVSNVWTINGGTYIVSFLAKASSNGAVCNMSRSLADFSPNFTLSTDWKYYSGVITLTATSTGGTLSFKTITANVDFYITRIKLENGNIATPYCPGSGDSNYAVFNINSNKEIDISGYSNHGTKNGTITYNSDTPRYSTSTVFNGSNTFIACGRGGMVKDEITINIWIYLSSWSSFSNPVSCTEGGGWNFEKNGTKIQFPVGTGTSSNTYKTVMSINDYSSLSAGWHMLTGTYDGLSLKIYIDGVLNNTTTAYTTKTPIFYNSANGIFIGAEAGGNQTTPAGTYFNGRISDFRIYATALSADDVKQLYQVSASIDNKGNVFCSDIQEV